MREQEQEYPEVTKANEKAEHITGELRVKNPGLKNCWTSMKKLRHY